MILLWKLFPTFPLFFFLSTIFWMLCIAMKILLLPSYLAPLWLSPLSLFSLLFEGWKIYIFFQESKKVTKSFFFLSLFLCATKRRIFSLSCISLGGKISYIHQKYTQLFHSLLWMTFIIRHIKFIIFVVGELLFFLHSQLFYCRSSYCGWQILKKRVREWGWWK